MVGNRKTTQLCKPCQWMYRGHNGVVRISACLVCVMLYADNLVPHQKCNDMHFLLLKYRDAEISPHPFHLQSWHRMTRHHEGSWTWCHTAPFGLWEALGEIHLRSCVHHYLLQVVSQTSNAIAGSQGTERDRNFMTGGHITPQAFATSRVWLLAVHKYRGGRSTRFKCVRSGR